MSAKKRRTRLKVVYLEYSTNASRAEVLRNACIPLYLKNGRVFKEGSPIVRAV